MSDRTGMNESNSKSESESRKRFLAGFGERYAHYFEFLGGRTSGKGKAKLRCKVCGCEFERFGNFVRMDVNTFCPRCHVHRDDEVSVPIDGRLLEHLGEMYASGMTFEQVSEATGIACKYMRDLIGDEYKEAHDKSVADRDAAAKAARNELRDATSRARQSVVDSFAKLSQEVKGYTADKVLQSATSRVGRERDGFGKTIGFVERYAPVVATCKHCGEGYLFFPKWGRYQRKTPGPYCSRRCKVKHNRACSNIGHRLRMYGSAGQPRDAIKLDDLIDRDNGTCYICGRKTSKSDHYYVHGWFATGDLYPTVDHVIPLSKGGTHTWGNVRLACRQCNSIKSNQVAHLPQATGE